MWPLVTAPRKSGAHGFDEADARAAEKKYYPCAWSFKREGGWRFFFEQAKRTLALSEANTVTLLWLGVVNDYYDLLFTS